MTEPFKWWCPCGHGPDDICLNGVIYGSCSAEECGGACIDDGTCKSLPGCCDSRELGLPPSCCGYRKRRDRRTCMSCPTCQSPRPSMHPAVSGGGEVTRICPDIYHALIPQPAEPYPTSAPEHYLGVRVPDNIARNWDDNRVEVSWWKRGVESAVESRGRQNTVHYNGGPGKPVWFGRRLYTEDIDTKEDYSDNPRTEAESPEEANLVSSESAYIDDLHFPVIDIDHSGAWVPSTNPDHGHLYINKGMSWSEYTFLLRAMVYVGLVEEGYLNAAISRGATFVRKPGVRKPAGALKAGCGPAYDKRES